MRRCAIQISLIGKSLTLLSRAMPGAPHWVSAHIAWRSTTPPAVASANICRASTRSPTMSCKTASKGWPTPGVITSSTASLRASSSAYSALPAGTTPWLILPAPMPRLLACRCRARSPAPISTAFSPTPRRRRWQRPSTTSCSRRGSPVRTSRSAASLRSTMTSGSTAIVKSLKRRKRSWRRSDRRQSW